MQYKLRSIKNVPYLDSPNAIHSILCSDILFNSKNLRAQVNFKLG